MEFLINLTTAASVISQMEAEKNKLNQYQSYVQAAISKCPLSGSTKQAVVSSLKNVSGALLSESSSLASMSKSLEQIIAAYRATEQQLASVRIDETTQGTAQENDTAASEASVETAILSGFFSYIAALIASLTTKLKNIIIPTITPIEIDSIVYDVDGEYGGDQGSPKNETSIDRKQELYDVVRSYYPDENLTDKQISNFLKKLNSEGCGYVAMINTIFNYYEGNAEVFESDFGFPMYEEDGSLNYDRMLVDIYASMDNRADGIIDYSKDYSTIDDGPWASYDYWNDTTGSGTNQFNRQEYLEIYMKNHGVTANVTTNANVTVYNFHKFVENGEQVIVAAHQVNLYNMDGTVKQYINGGHAMTVTGVTEDGKFIVSSWGGQYYIDPNEFSSSTTFATVSYEA